MLVLLGTAAFTAQDMIIRLVSEDYPLYQAFFLRGITAVPLSLLLVYLLQQQPSLKGSTLRMSPRSALMVIVNLLFYAALATLPMATACVLLLTGPLMLVVLSFLFLKEEVNNYQWGAIVAGLIGVVVIIHPGENKFEWAMVLPLLSALAYAFSLLWVRKWGRSDNSSVIAFQETFWLSLMGLLMGLALGFGELDWEIKSHPSAAFLLRGWQWPLLSDALILLLSGVFGAVATYCVITAYTKSRSSILAPFEYTALIWALLFGWLAWQHLPTPREWLGMAIVVGASLLALLHAKEGNVRVAKE